MKRMLAIVVVIVIAMSFVTCKGGGKRPVLYLFNWTDYISPDMIRQFEREHRCRVVLDTYDSNESMMTKLLTSNAAYDIIVPSGDHISILIQNDLLSKIDKSLLSNYKNLDPRILSKSEGYDLEYGYFIPYFWGTSGIIYNRRYLSDEEMADVSWDIFADQRFANDRVITFFDDMREVIGCALIFNGFDPNDYSDEALSQARETLLRWSRNVAQYDSDSYKNEIQDGTIKLGMAYNGDALQVMEENDEVGFTLPREGSTLWIDFLAIPKNSENKELAHKFIDFLLSVEVALANAEYVMYATPNVEAYKLLDDSIKENRMIYPTAEYLEKCFLVKNIGDNILKFDRIWQELRHN
jgi:spermidine/putrescine transport system substrate-binding protein